MRGHPRGLRSDDHAPSSRPSEPIHELHVLLSRAGSCASPGAITLLLLALIKSAHCSDEGGRWATARTDSRYFIVTRCGSAPGTAQPEERMRVMRDRIACSTALRRSIETNTSYSFGLDDQEFVVAFETDEPGDFLDLVQERREPPSRSAYTESKRRSSTCISTASVGRALTTLDGEPNSRPFPGRLPEAAQRVSHARAPVRLAEAALVGDRCAPSARRSRCSTPPSSSSSSSSRRT